MMIKLIRHGESEANTGLRQPHLEKDSAIPLSAKGIQQATHAGELIGQAFLNSALLYCSPYMRTRQTMQCILQGGNINKQIAKIYEDPRLREIDVGYDDPDEQMALRRIHGWFYYRFKGGESPADCYDRTSAFLESMMRELNRSGKSNVLIVCHGMTLRCFIARFFHLTVEQFESLENPNNGDIVTIGKKGEIAHPVFETTQWAVDGLSIRPD